MVYILWDLSLPPLAFCVAKSSVSTFVSMKELHVYLHLIHKYKSKKGPIL